MRTEIDRLNRSLYAPSGDGWQGDALAELCRDLEREHQPDDLSSTPGLAPLNPSG